jgi:pimeloyl-ACP methyl ester carboxylesterase
MSETGYREFHWLERGQGEPLVLLHGLMGRMDHWEGVLDSLGDVCRPIALALPILDSDLREPSILELSRHVHEFLQALEIPRAVIGGNSLGGHVALTLALDHPERVSGLVLGSSGLFERSFTRGVPHRPSSAYVRQKMEEVVFDSTLVTPEWVESVHEIVTTPFSALRVLRFCAGGPTSQHRGSPDRDSGADAPRLRAGRPDHAARGGGAFSAAHAGCRPRALAGVRARPPCSNSRRRSPLPSRSG